MTKKKQKKRTIGVMTQDRGAMPPPQRADENKRKKNDRKKVKKELKEIVTNLDKYKN